MIEKMNEDLLWQPSVQSIEQSTMRKFMRYAQHHSQQQFAEYDDLYRWSIDQREQFWSLLWGFCDVIGERGERTLQHPDDIEKSIWFADSKVNFAENLLRNRSDDSAIIFQAEDQRQQQISFRELYRQVAALSHWLRAQGVQSGDRVAAYLPNIPQTVVAMLATSSLGAVWTSTSPDFGVESVIDRFGQTTPRILFVCDGYFYNGKTIDVRDKVRQIRAGLPSVEQVVEFPLADLAAGEYVPWQSILESEAPDDIDFTPTGFNHPLYILYSSGTTGKPKCITHKVGGVLLQHLKEHRLHAGIKKGDRVFYFTTCGWMMWNWLVSALASEATLLLYDGAPFYPDGNVLWDFAERTGMTLFGTSAKYLDALNQQQYRPIETHDLSSLRTLCSTGSVLAPESFDYVYQSIKRDINLASISGGTDIVSCFVLGNPMLPVYRGESQCRGLGMAVEVFSDSGESLLEEKGELVCTRSFPSQPLCFWGDESGEKYHNAYFTRFDSVWHHGDYSCLTRHGGMVIYGRSDATLNPGGVRIGTAEIYRHVEQLDEVVESIVIGQEWQQDVRVVLFVVLASGLQLDAVLCEKIRQTIRQKCTPRHMPARVIQVSEIPRTRSGKIVELAVRDVVHGREVKNLGALANPQALDQFRDLEALKS